MCGFTRLGASKTQIGIQFSVLTAFAFWFGGSGSAAAQAGTVDLAFRKQGNKIIEHLKKHNVQTVGVLKFMVKIDEGDYHFREPFSTVMAVRLENLLVLGNDSDNPINVTRNAHAVALEKDPDFTYLSPTGRLNLFQHTYPMAWGKQHHKVDMFLTGGMHVQSKTNKSNIKIAALDDQAGYETICELTVNNDADLLVDMRESSVLSRQKVKQLKPGKFGEAVWNGVWERNKKGAVNQPGDRLVDLKVIFNQKQKRVKPHPQKPGEGQLPGPLPSDKMVVELRNVTAERVGVVLVVNGITALGMEPFPDVSFYQCTPVVLQKNKGVKLSGYYPNFNKMLFFSEHKDIRENSLVLLVFVERENPAVDPIEKLFSLRYPLPTDKGRPASFADARRWLAQKLYPMATKKSLLLPPEPVQDPKNIKSLDLQNPTLQEVRVIWFEERG